MTDAISEWHRYELFKTAFYIMKQNPTSIEKAIHVLLAFDQRHPNWGVRRLSEHLGFSAATVQRILKTFKDYHLVDQNPVTRQYRLGAAFYHFIQTLQQSYPITRVAPEFMRHLSRKTGETVHLNVIEGENRVCIDSVEANHPLKASMPVGSRSPLYAGASSKCLLAFSDPVFRESYLEKTTLSPVTANTIVEVEKLRVELARIRRNGYAESLAERNPGLGSLSAPIFNHQGSVLAALSLAIPEIRYRDLSHRKLCLEEILATARRISRSMGFRKVEEDT